MASVNKVIIVGNLGAAPEVRYTTSGQAVANFSVATSDRWTDKDGNRQQRTEWHRIVVWGKQAENCGSYLKKGRSVYIEGRIQTRDYADPKDSTQKRYVTEIIASQIQFLGGRDGGDEPENGGFSPPQNTAAAKIQDEDVPF